MGLAIFENYSQSKEGTDHSPFIVHTTQVNCLDVISKWVKESGFTNIEINRDYFEIYGEKDGFEMTIIITSEEQGALVNMSVLGKTGKTRKKLKEYLSQLIAFIK